MDWMFGVGMAFHSAGDLGLELSYAAKTGTLLAVTVIGFLVGHLICILPCLHVSLLLLFFLSALSHPLPSAFFCLTKFS